MQRALVSLQLQLQLKLRELHDQQEILLKAQTLSLSEYEIFDTSVKRIDRSLESFTAHADNLSHIKLTLARAAAFVSSVGNLALLVTKQQPQHARNSQQDPDMLSSLGPSLLSSSARFVGPSLLSSNGQCGTNASLGWSLTASIPEESSQCGISDNGGTHYRIDSSAVSNARWPIIPFNNARGGISEKEPELDRLHMQNSLNRIPNSTCFVFYLPPTSTNESLRSLFVGFGTVLSAYVSMDKVTNRPRGFGFVDFSTPGEALAAVRALDKFPLEGKRLSVSIKI
jgi:hypothetical protein